MRRPGRPTKLTPELHERIVRGIQAGVWVETVCALVGIHKDTFYAWKKRGEAELERLAENPRARMRKAEAPYAEFSDAIARAEAEAETRNVAIIQKAASGWEWERRTIKTRKLRDPKGNVIGEEVEEKIHTGRDYDWRAAMEWLERRFPKRWAQRYKHEVTGEDGGPIEMRELSDDELEQRARQQAARLAAMGQHGRNGGNGRP